MLQTPVLACSPRVLRKPRSVHTSLPEIEVHPQFSRQCAVALVYAGPTSTTSKVSSRDGGASSICSASALLHSFTRDQRHPNNSLSPSLRYTPQLSRPSTVGLAHAGPASPPRLFLSEIEVHPQLSQRSTRRRARRNSATWRAPRRLAARPRRPSALYATSKRTSSC